MPPVFQWAHHKFPPIPPPSSRSPSIQKQVNMTYYMQDKKGGKNNVSAWKACIYSINSNNVHLQTIITFIITPSVCIYNSPLFSSRGLKLFSLQIHSRAEWAWISSFCCFFRFAQGLRNHLSGPGGEKKYSDNTVYVYAHVSAHVLLFCVCIHFKSCHLPLSTAACNRPSMKARQLAIRGRWRGLWDGGLC